MWINGRELTGRALEEEFWADFDEKLAGGQLTNDQAVSAIQQTLDGLVESEQAGYAALQRAVKKG
jgi:hypothetical protein